LNQLGYAHTPAFHESKHTVDGEVADDSYVRMVDNLGQVKFATGKDAFGKDTFGSTDVPTAEGRAEAFLSREVANTGKMFTPERQSEVYNHYLDMEYGVKEPPLKMMKGPERTPD